MVTKEKKWSSETSWRLKLKYYETEDGRHERMMSDLAELEYQEIKQIMEDRSKRFKEYKV